PTRSARRARTSTPRTTTPWPRNCARRRRTRPRPVSPPGSRSSARPGSGSADVELDDALGLIAEVPDFPEPGVLFRDLSPLFADAGAFKAVTDALASTIDDRVEALAG